MSGAALARDTGMLPVPGEIPHLVAAHGVWIVAVVVGLESIGLPVPGETTLIAAALITGASGRPGIVAIVMAAAAGAIVGDNIGYRIGREVGYRWLVRHGTAIHLTPRRLKLGQYLFSRRGGAVVFFGRFVAVLRVLAALLAGINCMKWRRFLVFNASGAVVWASLYGAGAYKFGQQMERVAKPVGIGLLGAAAVLVIFGLAYLHRYEQRLEDEAERALPGPLRR